MALSNLGLLLSRLGRREDALVAGIEAAQLCRRLVEADPDTHTADLGESLSNLGLALVELGRREEALTVNREAVGIRRRLAQADPGQHLPDLARH
jgi:tetratricopeptide (TPR) repeat protein